MSKQSLLKIWELISHRFVSHPWHGIHIGDDAPKVVTAFIEITPADNVKYEIDKISGYLKVDRPQKFSNVVPALYGFIPRTYCDAEVAKRCMDHTGRTEVVGDHDPLDICVLTERNITKGNILIPVRPIGGFRMVDAGEADDKIIAILRDDEAYSAWQDITDVPESIIQRLKHYFLTYKQIPNDGFVSKCSIDEIYNKKEAFKVIEASVVDYKNHFGSLEMDMSKTALEAIMYGIQSMEEPKKKD
jgi:inorganic pyrophosphatase